MVVEASVRRQMAPFVSDFSQIWSDVRCRTLRGGGVNDSVYWKFRAGHVFGENSVPLYTEVWA